VSCAVVRLPEAISIPNADNTFCGAQISQAWRDLPLWEQFFNRHLFQGLIELGTWRGGMAAFLAMQCKARNIRFATIDSKAHILENREIIEFLDGSCLTMDVFNLELISGVIQAMPKPLLLFCDNGDKRREVRDIAPLLKPDDFVAVHDWNSEIGADDIPAHWNPIGSLN
jgi:hypothetical protein